MKTNEEKKCPFNNNLNPQDNYLIDESKNSNCNKNSNNKNPSEKGKINLSNSN